MSDLATLRAVHLAAAMQSDHVSDLQRLVRAGVQALAKERLPCTCGRTCNCGCGATTTDAGLTCRCNPPDLLTQSDIARALGISRQRVGQLATEPVDEEAREAWRNLTKEYGA